MGELPGFDELKELARTDPQAFDRLRQTVCEEFINSIPAAHQRRLKGVQFRVNHEIRRAKTPLAGLIKVSGMMHDSLHELSDHLQELKRCTTLPLARQAPRPATVTAVAEVVSLEQWRRHGDRKRRRSN
ncbi:DUF3135 domain-containing protein [Motiliproteus sp. SC1-56]|uniref:DUF3135 domain-containing protein n=1 Tax=Motiliproteus sp. SC1-56 TaxID=2799565 RepID=UPI001A8CA35F|nr:DUF3135 domain-containing protein [Motiliproteus sp. SC1-56]